MTVTTHAYDADLLQDRGSTTTGVANATSHVAMIMRFVKFALSLVLIAIVVTAVMAIRVVAWFPPFHH
jgi:hypothetical protein